MTAPMIAKRITRDTAASSFQRLGAYILKDEAVEASTIALTAQYILDLPGDGARAANVRVTNCRMNDPARAIQEIVATQAMNTRAKGDKTYHLVVSFPKGERPAVEQLTDIEAELCAAIGLEEHQRLSATHIDTECLHVHLAINKVHPASYRFVEPYYDKRKLMAACTRLEIKHGLIGTPHSAAEKRREPDRVRDMEAHAGVASFLRWIKENAGEALRAAAAEGRGWQDLHERLAAYDLEIRPRGAGLIIAPRDTSGGKIWAVKASDADRSLSIHALTRRWGAYDPAGDAARTAAPRQRYQPQPLSGGSEELYAGYLRERAAAGEERNAAQATLRSQQEHNRSELRDGYKASYARLKSHRGLRGATKREAYKQLHSERTVGFAAQGREAKAAFAAFRQEHPLPNWMSYLQEHASRGDGRALEALRQLQTRQARAAEALLRAENPEQARHVVFDKLRPHTRKNGAVVYRVKDGGLVVDETDAVRVEELTAHAAFLALSLASERFAGQALIVEGSDEFKQQIARLAGSKRLDVRFADPAIEAGRQRHAAQTVAANIQDRSTQPHRTRGRR
jgi:hypothetical protein